MTDEAALLRAVHERPHDDTPRLALADWLEEHADATVACPACAGTGRRSTSPRRTGKCHWCGGKKEVPAHNAAWAELIRAEIELTGDWGRDDPAHRCAGEPCRHCAEVGRRARLTYRQGRLWAYVKEIERRCGVPAGVDGSTFGLARGLPGTARLPSLDAYFDALPWLGRVVGLTGVAIHRRLPVVGGVPGQPPDGRAYWYVTRCYPHRPDPNNYWRPTGGGYLDSTRHLLPAEFWDGLMAHPLRVDLASPSAPLFATGDDAVRAFSDVALAIARAATARPTEDLCPTT